MKVSRNPGGITGRSGTKTAIKELITVRRKAGLFIKYAANEIKINAPVTREAGVITFQYSPRVLAERIISALKTS